MKLAYKIIAGVKFDNIFASPTDYLSYSSHSPFIGECFYNSTLNQFQYWNGTSWVAIGSGISGAILSLNSLTTENQFLNTGTSGTDFNIISSGTTHTFNIPNASATGRGLVSTSNWTYFYNNLGNLNGLTNLSQSFATGTSGTDFNIDSSGSTHTFNIPNASTSHRGMMTTSTQSFNGIKTFVEDLNIITGQILKSSQVLLALINDNCSKLGLSALNSITTGQHNIGIGFSALSALTTQSNNIGIGTSAGAALTGTGNIAIGFNAILNVASVNNNIAIGHLAAINKTSIVNSILIGHEANNNTGSVNNSVFIGFDVAKPLTSSTNNIILHSISGWPNLPGGTQNIIFFANSLDTTTNNNSVVLGFNTSYRGGRAVVVGHGCRSSGKSSLSLNAESVTIGFEALWSLASVSLENVVIGYKSGRNWNNSTTGCSYNTVVGNLCGGPTVTVSVESLIVLGNNNHNNWNITTGSSIIRGIVIGNNNFPTTGGWAIGYNNTLTSPTGDAIDTRTIIGSFNHAIDGLNVIIGSFSRAARYTIAMGYYIGANTTSSAQRNVLIGYETAFSLTSGNQNVLIGAQAGYNLTTGNNNVFLGTQAGFNVTTGSSNIIIGNNINAPTATTSNYLSIGNMITADATNVDINNRNVVLQNLGFKIRLTEGANAAMGVATLSSGTVTVNTTAVTANSRILVTIQSPSGTVGPVYISARTAGVSFTISSVSGNNSQVAWMILDPA